MSEITQSLDWPKVQREMEGPVRRLGKYSGQMLKISKNIGFMVSELSKEEINCRRQGKQTKRHQELLLKINEEISNYEQMLTFGALLSGADNAWLTNQPK